jgi:hypothetical protein
MSQTVTGRSRGEAFFGVSITILASILAINELGGGKFAEDELAAGNEKTTAFMWYQAKSIKETAVKCQADLIDSLLTHGLVNETREDAIRHLRDNLQQQIARYKLEKTEILNGSAQVGRENWVQDVDGHLGQVIGALEFEAKQERLSKASDWFDVSSLFLQISLVLGAVGLIMYARKLKLSFFFGMLVLGIIGTFFCAMAYMSAFGVF